MKTNILSVILIFAVQLVFSQDSLTNIANVIEQPLTIAQEVQADNFTDTIKTTNPQALIKAANTFYTEGKFKVALKYYLKVEELGYVSAELYYNIGNANYKMNDIASAILYYERALKLKPNDKDAKNNLILAQAFVVDKIENIPEIFIGKWLRNFRNIFNSNIWVTISMLSFILFIFFAAIYLFSGTYRLKKISFFIAVISVFVSVTSLIIGHKQYKNEKERREAIVMSPTVAVKSSPVANSTDLFVLHEGIKVYIEDSTQNNWYEIKITDGRVGWLKKEDIEKI